MAEAILVFDLAIQFLKGSFFMLGYSHTPEWKLLPHLFFKLACSQHVQMDGILNSPSSLRNKGQQVFTVKLTYFNTVSIKMPLHNTVLPHFYFAVLIQQSALHKLTSNTYKQEQNRS